MNVSLENLPSCCKDKYLQTHKLDDPRPGGFYHSIDSTMGSSKPKDLKPDSKKHHRQATGGDGARDDKKSKDKKDKDKKGKGLDVPDVDAEAAAGGKPTYQDRLKMRILRVVRKGRTFVLRPPVLSVMLGRPLAEPTYDALKNLTGATAAAAALAGKPPVPVPA